jgi:hypothetical protein
MKNLQQPLAARAAAFIGLEMALASLCSCIPFVFVLPLPAPIILNHPYQARVVDERTLKPVSDVSVRVRVYRTWEHGGEMLLRDYQVRSRADGTVYIPRQTDPGLIVIWAVGVFAPCAGKGGNGGVATGGVVTTEDTRIVLTLSRAGYVSREIACLERRRKDLGNPPCVVPDLVQLKPSED